MAAAQERDDALVASRVTARTAIPVAIANRDLLAGRCTFKQQLALARFELGPRHVKGDAVLFADRLEQPDEPLAGGASPRGKRSGGNRQLVVRNDQLAIDFISSAEAIARVTGAVRELNEKLRGAQFLERAAGGRRVQVLAEGQNLRFGCFTVSGRDHVDPHVTVSQAQRSLHRLGQALLNLATHHEPVDDDLDVVVDIAVQALDLVGVAEVQHSAVDRTRA